MTRLITEGFENANDNTYNTCSLRQVTGNAGLAKTAKTKSRSGEWSYKIGPSPNSFGNDAEVSFGTETEVYIRFAFLMDTVNCRPIVEFRSQNLPYGLVINYDPYYDSIFVWIRGEFMGYSYQCEFGYNTWYLTEIHFKCDATNGILQIKVDGEMIVDYAGDTSGLYYNNFDSIYFGHHLMESTHDYSVYIDDLAINDIAGAEDNSWCGDGHIAIVKVSNNGDASQLLGSDNNKTDNYLLVQEASTDEGNISTDNYVHPEAVDDYDTYTINTDTLPDNIQIQRVRVRSISYKGGSSHTMQHILRKSSTNYLGNQFGAYSTTITRCLETWRSIDPQSSSSWTKNLLSSYQIGIINKEG